MKRLLLSLTSTALLASLAHAEKPNRREHAQSDKKTPTEQHDKAPATALEKILDRLVEDQKINRKDATRITRAALADQAKAGKKKHKAHGEHHHDHEELEKMAHELEHLIKGAKKELLALREARTHLTENNHQDHDHGHADDHKKPQAKVPAPNKAELQKKAQAAHQAAFLKHQKIQESKAAAEKEASRMKAEVKKRDQAAKAKAQADLEAHKKHAAAERKKFETLRQDAEKRANALMEQRKNAKKLQHELEQKRRKLEKEAKAKKQAKKKEESKEEQPK